MMKRCDMLEKIDGQQCCKVATYWANGHPTEVSEAACKVCIGTPTPRGLNRVTVALGLGKLREEDPAAYQAKLPSSLEHLTDPGAGEALMRYVESTKAWVLQGKPVRTDAQVLAILDICNGCEQFDGAKCGICGCMINVGGGWTSKARRLNEHCPLEKW
jgi:hypothetical protein